MRKLITRSEAAKDLGVSSQTISNWIRRGLIQGQMIGGFQYVEIDTLKTQQSKLKELVLIQTELDSMIERNKQDLNALKDRQEELRKYLRIDRLTHGRNINQELILMVLWLSKDYLNAREYDIMTDFVKGENIEEQSRKYNLSIPRIYHIARHGCRRMSNLTSLLKTVQRHEEMKKEITSLKRLCVLQKRKIRDLDESLTAKKAQENSLMTIEELHICKLLETPIADTELPYRCIYALRCLDVETVEDILKYKICDFMKFRNFGKKSLADLQSYLMMNGLSFGMDVTTLKDKYMKYLSNVHTESLQNGKTAIVSDEGTKDTDSLCREGLP